MKFQSAVVAAFAVTAAAYPSYGNPEEAMAKRDAEAAAAAAAEAQSGLLGVVTGVGDLIGGLLGSVAQNVKGSDKRPEPGFPYMKPKSTDSRGPCPGLNLLANHGYLPRDGHVTLGQVLEATARGFNMATDLSTVLGVFAVLTDGDIATESWYLGAGPGNIGGLNRHSTVEADISPNREDYYNGCGDNHHLSSRLFKQNVAIAAASASKQFDADVMGKQYAANAQFSKTYNPYLYAFPFPQIVSLGAFIFYPQFFSNGTYGLGGVANYESISSIIGASWQSGRKEFSYVPEKFPENWYRRAIPWGAVDTLLADYLVIYPYNPVVPGASQLFTPNLTPQTLLCDLYMGLNSIIPLMFADDAAKANAALAWALSKLEPAFKGTVLGCPPETLSKNPSSIFFPNQKGGPTQPPPAQVARSGNNVYGKVYFGGNKAPTTPACSA